MDSRARHDLLHASKTLAALAWLAGCSPAALESREPAASDPAGEAAADEPSTGAETAAEGETPSPAPGWNEHESDHLDAPAGRDPNVIRRVVRHAGGPGISGCFETAVRARPEIVDRRVVVEFDITAGGAVEAAAVTLNETGDEALGECILGVLRAIAFPPCDADTPPCGLTHIAGYPFVAASPPAADAP
jgi:hypothetical protein